MEGLPQVTLSEKNYNAGQWFVRIFIPAWITFYSSLALFVGVPKVAEVAGVSGAVAVFLGALLASSSSKFKKENEADGGYFQLLGSDENGMPRIGLDVRTDPADLANKKTVTLKIDTPPVVNPASPELEDPAVDNTPPWEKRPDQV